MAYTVPEDLNADLHEPARVNSQALPWTPSPLPGVDRRFLARDGGEVAVATSLVRYAPNSRFSEHVHERGEEFLVLQGVFSDASGDYGVGSYVRNPPGSSHAPFTKEGCIIFVKLRQMQDSESEQLVVDTQAAHPDETEVPGLTRLALFADEHGERVGIETLEANRFWFDRENPGGEEILVLKGMLEYGGRRAGPGYWLRIPAGRLPDIRATEDARYWVKRGHLPG